MRIKLINFLGVLGQWLYYASCRIRRLKMRICKHQNISHDPIIGVRCLDCGEWI